MTVVVTSIVRLNFFPSPIYFTHHAINRLEPAGSPPTHDASAVEPEYYAATRVWKVDSTTGAITFEYVNPDGSIPTGQTAVTFWCPEYGASASSSSVFVTSNPQLFRDAFVEKYKSELQDPDSCYVNELVSRPSTFLSILVVESNLVRRFTGVLLHQLLKSQSPSVISSFYDAQKSRFKKLILNDFSSLAYYRLSIRTFDH